MRALAATVASAAFLLCAGAAQAAVTTSNITSPASGLFLQATDDPPSSNTLTVTGTSNGTSSDSVRIRCYFDNGDYRNFASGVSVNSDGTFSDTGDLSNIEGHACRLRAQDSSVNFEDPAFAGPRLAVGEFDTYSYVLGGGPNVGDLTSFRAKGITFSGWTHWNSPGECGVGLASIDTSYSISDNSFYCVGSLFGDDGISRSEIQVDGNNAYDVNAAADLFSGAGNNIGLQQLTVANNFNSANGFESTTDTEPIVECPAPDSYLPDNSTCPSYGSAGVTLQRTSSMIGSNQVEVTDKWSSTDGKAHSVDTLYDDSVGSSGSGPGYEFPGQTGFTAHTTGDVIGGPASAPGSILVHNDVGAIDGDPNEQYGAITFASAPSQFAFTASDQFTENQTLSVPAGGSASLTYIYSTGTTSEGVQALALAAQDQLKSPAVSITSPPNGAKVKGKTVAVSGTATAGSGINSVTVNGHAASVSSSGTWSANLPLGKGTNTLTATATSNTGRTASASISVFAKGCKVPGVSGLKLSKAEKKIRHAGCTVGKITRVASSIAKGHATGTKPHKGKKRKPGANITLFVSKGP